MAYKYFLESIADGRPYQLKEEGISIKSNFIITGHSAIQQKIPYQPLLYILKDRTFTVKRLIAKHFSEAEWQDIENRILPKARQWNNRGVGSIEITIQDLTLWERIGEFIHEFAGIQSWY